MRSMGYKDHVYNSTDSFLPTTLLEQLLPGYGSIHRLATHTLGFDATVLVSIGAALWILIKICRSIWTGLILLIKKFYTSEISVDSTDEIYDHVISVFAGQLQSTSRRIRAETRSKSTWDNKDTESSQLTPYNRGRSWLNFSNQAAKSEPRFTPAIGSHYMSHQGRSFTLQREEVAINDRVDSRATSNDKERLTLSCRGRCTGPIKILLQHAKAEYHLGHHDKTIIKRPATQGLRRFGACCWVRVAEKPCRPMETVVLDEERKLEVLDNVNTVKPLYKEVFGTEDLFLI